MADSILKNSNNSMKIKPFVCGCDKRLAKDDNANDRSTRISLQMTMHMTVRLTPCSRS